MSVTTFSNLTYTRPDLESIHSSLVDISTRMRAAASAAVMIDIVEEWNTLRRHVYTMHSLAEVHYSQNVADTTKKEEKKFYDEHNPEMTEWNIEVEKAIIDSPYRTDLIEKYGRLFVTILENNLKVFTPEIEPLLIEESDLCNRYNELTAKARIELDGKTYNLSTIGAIVIELDRDRRKRATEAMYNYIGMHAEELDSIYDQLVKLRTKKAKMLGFPSYTEYRYIEMGRVDYTIADVQAFRDQVIEHVVPLSQRIREAQMKRLGLNKLSIYDEKLDFPDGNPIAAGEHDFIVDAARKMYSELSPETEDFFEAMLAAELLDLKSRDNKATGGYCTSFAEVGMPFIFANFNRTTHDVEVLTHEAGHAFQAYRSRTQIVPEYYWPTSEACEIHSMGMEFLTWPWMEMFFRDQTDKFKFYHLEGAIKFLPYGCAVDQFQHWVYQHPDATSAERNEQWLAMERLYMPWRDNSEIAHARDGRQWQFQRHIYESPFYYIDYALAQTCSLQFWAASQADRKQAFKDYLRICDIGGSQSFLQIVESGNLVSPFKSGTLKTVFGGAMEWLEKTYPQYL